MTNFYVQLRSGWGPRLALPAVFAITLVAAPFLNAQSDNSRDAALKRVTADIKYLASDELGGRQPGTPGMEKAEKYILDDYEKIGLKKLDDGTYVQPFGVGGTRTLKKDATTLTLMGPNDSKIELELDKHFKPQISRRGFDVDGGVVFVGYGIRAEEHNYDEFADIDAEGKVVVMIRMEPQQADASSVFDGNENSQYAFIRTKIAAARRAGAVAVLMVNDGVTAPNDEQDELADYDQFGVQRVPFANITRAAFNQVLDQTPLLKGDGTKFDNLAEAEADIDRNLESLSQELEGWSCSFKADFEQSETIANNLIGIIEGEGPHADETIVIGGHHDHLGMGDYGSRAGRREIHNGADDNATGTAAVVELARRFAARGEKPKRRLVFVCFSAEEMGLLGARHYVENPVIPLDKTVAMINFDMIGWLRDKNVTVFNWNSSESFKPVLDKANENFGLNLNLPESAFAGSDHLPFYQKGIPVMFFHTGLTDTYHTPEDDFETIDCDGALSVIEYTEAVVDGIANLEDTPKFAEGRGGNRQGGARPSAPRVRLGAILDEDNEKGVAIDTVQEDSLAAKAGLQAGDIITEFAGKAVSKRREIVIALRREAGNNVTIKFLRGEEEMSVEVELKN